MAKIKTPVALEKVGEENGAPVFVEVWNLDEVIKTYECMLEDAMYDSKKARAPKAKRIAKRSAEFYGSTLHYLRKLKEVKHG